MAPKRNARSALRRPSGQSYKRKVPRVARLGLVLPRPLGRTVTTLHRESGISIAGPIQGHLRLSTDTHIQPGYAEPRETLPPENVENTLAGRARYEPGNQTEHPPTSALWLPDIDVRPSPQDIVGILERINDYFEQWSRNSTVDSRGPANLLEDMTAITDRLQTISALSQENLDTSQVERHLRKLKENYLPFVSLWKSYTQSELVQKLDQLYLCMRRSPTSIQERVFTTLLLGIQSVAAHPALPSFLGSARENMPPLLDPEFVVSTLRRCAWLQDEFQNLTYKSERRTLWLHIWRCLKKAFVSFDTGDLLHITDRRCLEVEFFEKPGVAREFKRLLRLPDAANPRSIENMVGKYCRFIDRCRADPNERYFHLRRLQEDPLREHVISSLRRFTESNILDSNTFPKLHFAVVRLNAINGGPAVVRRWNDGEGAQGSRLTSFSSTVSPATSSLSGRAWRPPSTNGENVQKHTPQHTPQPAPADTTSVIADVGSTTIDAKQPVPGQRGRIPSELSFPQPRGINLISDFDYVHCPFPETRAQEVAHSEQITRELATPGIYSEGLRAEYLINRPPAHARDSSSLFGSQYTRMFGPFGRLRTFIRRLLPGQSRPLSPVSLVARKNRGGRGADGHQAVIDPNSRIHKTTAALKLRGGGGGTPARSRSPQRKTSVDTNVNRSPSFRDQHIAMFRQMYYARHNSMTSLSEDEIWDLLERSAFRVANAVALHNQSVPVPRSGVPGNANEEDLSSPRVKFESTSRHVQHAVPSPSAERGSSRRSTRASTRDAQGEVPPVAATVSSTIPHWQGPTHMPRLEDPFYIPPGARVQMPQMPRLQDPFYLHQGVAFQAPILQDPFHPPQGGPIQLPPLQEHSYPPGGHVLSHQTTLAAPPNFDDLHGTPSRQSQAQTRNPLSEMAGGRGQDGHDLRPRSGRQPLGELVVEDNENLHGPAARGSTESDPNLHGSVTNTNQENPTSVHIHVDGPCHECPQFPGQYHHFCQCSIQPNRVRIPSDGRVSSSNESRFGSQREREPVIDDDDDDEDEPQGDPQGELEDDAEDDQDIQQAENDDDTESEQDIDQRGPHRAARVLPHPNDESPVQILVPRNSHFRNVLGVIGSVHLPGLTRMLTVNTATSMRSAEARASIRDAFNNLRRETNELRAAYKSLLLDTVPIEIDRIPRREVPRLHPAHPVTRALMFRELIDIEEQYRRILKMFDAGGLRSYLNLALRHALNRFLRLMRNLRRMFLEYDQNMRQQDAGAKRATPTTQGSETDSESFLSDEEQERVDNYNPRQRPPLPSRDDYAAMFRDELMREITIQRQIPLETVRASTRDQLIDKLVELDRQGNLGAGAQYGYRRLNNDAAARGRPRGWNLEDAINAYNTQHRDTRVTERSNKRQARVRKRRLQGLSLTKYWTGHAPTDQEPFSNNVRGVSDEEEFESSEDDSTSTEERT
ncbi:hypothetical protein PV08_04710 [Exophiala spinifera]|uniref:Uncharacterized protein n=1 Tax=Exophiala spinifera TaxID=91928 RepID=A0A0D1YQN4_9EURO|nr:uncharacterized protein PV08_04710 [Exophiala spinifera]KIW17516.1 hypothetical protein PV08_04710 [Exophiala spinifera]